MFHPWQDLASRTDVEVFWHALTARRLGATDGDHVIVLSPHQLQTQRRCTLAHELAHIDLGHVGGCSAHEEDAAAVLAARRLITVGDLADALVWSQDRTVVADSLWVDLDTLDTRLSHLTAGERDHITQRLAAREDGA